MIALRQCYMLLAVLGFYPQSSLWFSFCCCSGEIGYLGSSSCWFPCLPVSLLTHGTQTPSNKQSPLKGDVCRP